MEEENKKAQYKRVVASVSVAAVILALLSFLAVWLAG
jgi:hypothetical protein